VLDIREVGPEPSQKCPLTQLCRNAQRPVWNLNPSFPAVRNYSLNEGPDLSI